ncbi:MAG: LysR family transcriptional regulator [Micropepsaceae bacterium]
MSENSIDWTLLRSFLAVAELGSLSAAARSLRLTQPTLGRHVEELERQLRAKLFTRSARGLMATEAALELLPHARLMASTASALARAASGEAEEERGTVRLAASDVIGAEVLPAIVTAFRLEHPQVEIELVLSNRNENLLLRDADVAVRMIRPTQQALVARKIGDVPVRLYAHKNYVKRRGLPKTIEALRGHDLIGYDKVPAVFEGLGELGREISRNDFTLRCDNDLAQLGLLRAGAGIGGCQIQLAARQRDLLPVLHGRVELPLEMWLVMHEDLRVSRRVRVLYDYMSEALDTYVKGSKRSRRNSPVRGSRSVRK